MYYTQLPPKAKELKELAKRLDERYPNIQVEFGVEDEMVATGVFILNKRLLYAYTSKDMRRGGLMTEHIQALLNRDMLDSAVCPPNDCHAIALLAKCKFVPVGFYHPLDDGEEQRPHINFRKADDVESKFGAALLESADAWVENGLVVEQLPIQL